MFGQSGHLDNMSKTMNSLAGKKVINLAFNIMTTSRHAIFTSDIIITTMGINNNRRLLFAMLLLLLLLICFSRFQLCATP